MPRGSVRPATPEDAKAIAPILRNADRQECIAHLGKEPEKVLPGCVALSTVSYALLDRNKDCIGIFGVAPTPGLPLVGAVWMVATPELEKYAIQFLRGCETWINKMHESYPVLANLVDARNTLHIRWIKWCGFTLLDTRHCYGAAGIPFIEFAKVK